MTLADLLTALQDDLGYDAIPSASVTRRLTKYLNEGYRLILSMPELGPLRSDTLPFASVAGQKTYGLPQTFVSIDQMVDTTNNIRLRLMTQDQFRTIDPQEVSSGTPTHYVPLGLSTVKTQPETTGLWVNSRSPADTTQTVTLLGVRGFAGVNFPLEYLAYTVTAALDGFNRVQFETIPDWINVQQFELSALTLGPVGLFTNATSGAPIAVIDAGRRTVQYQSLRLWPTPAGVYDYQVDGSFAILDLSATVDVPVIPADFQYMLADYGRWREYEYRDDSRAAVARAQFQEKLKYLRDRICDPPDFRPRVGRIPDRSSNLGSYYPPGRW